MLAEFERVAANDEIVEGEITEHRVGGKDICLARSNGVVYAFSASCTHQECPLSDGYLEGNQIECECHGARFDLATGEVTLPPATEPLPVYQVRVDAEAVWVDPLGLRSPTG
jgi:nitrite reductase/ring-hydroxylating ferredoxin subunit